MKIIVGSALLACVLIVPAHAEDCKHTAHRTANSAGALRDAAIFKRSTPARAGHGAKEQR